MVPEDAFLLGADIHERQQVRAGREQGLAAQFRLDLPVHLTQLRHVAQVNEPSVDAADSAEQRGNAGHGAAGSCRQCCPPGNHVGQQARNLETRCHPA